MDVSPAGPLVVAMLSIFLFATLCACLVLTVVSLRKPAVPMMSIAGTLLVLATILAAISPVDVPALWGIAIAMVGIAVAVLGGNPATRLVLELATGGRVRETPDGGILIASSRPKADADGLEPLLRGGTTIGYLERLAVAVAIIAGYPEAIAVVVAIKGIGRFSELAEAEARERFIIGTFASLVWACVAGALVRLAIW
ncbi:hypothetical protein AB3M83_06110 [Microbacterium sp. 179-B 1A2 NHS]|uniref:hypothetical protein n=1 Tax=Microbacterium sp. 179-B 1A2 NHS TaxID=3142383 RepID=UPI0039A0C563